jgi:hypothetical protein
VTSPNEPGYPRSGDGPGSANGSVAGSPGADGGTLGNSAGPRSGQPAPGSATPHVTEPGDVPPWQRGPAARGANQPHRPPPESQTRTDSLRAGGPVGHSPGVDARINRFVSGGGGAPSTPPQAQDADQPNPPNRNEAARSEAYASELPDLSGPVPRSPQRKAPAERIPSDLPSKATPSSSRVHVGNRAHGPVRASMQVRRIDPWSALKVSLVLSVAQFFVWMIAVAFLYLVLGGMGVWSKLNSNVGDLLTSASGSTGELVSSGTIFGGAALIGLVNIVLLTAMGTIGAFIYNLTTDIVGGIEVTLADRD